MAAESIFNYFVGGLALLSTLFSMLLYLNVYLPGPQLKVFDELLLETRNIYEKAFADGLLPPDLSVEAQVQLQKYETQGNDLRVVTYRTLSSFEILLSFFGGHSAKIRRLAKKLMQLRSKLLTTSQEELTRRRGDRLIREGCGIGTDTSSTFVTEGSHSPDSSTFSPSAESIHQTAESTDDTSSPFTDNSSTLFDRWISCICSMRNWLSPQASRASAPPSLPQPQSEGGREPSSPDIDVWSRSSTMVQDPPPKKTFLHRPWSLLARWVHPVGVPTRRDDLEARLGIPNSIGSHAI